MYVIADAVGRGPRRRVKLIAYRYHRQGYKPIAPDDNGRIYLAPVRLWLGTTHDRLDGFVRLACYDPDSGEELGDAVATRQELVETRARVEAEADLRLLFGQEVVPGDEAGPAGMDREIGRAHV